MKAALLPAYDAELSIEDVPPPEVQGASDVIVRIGGAGVCRTDLHIIEGIWKEKVDVELPYILGHENAGWVEDVAAAVRSVKPGDAVIVHPVITCGLCRACRAGEDMHCIDLSFPGITTNGGFAEYLRTGLVPRVPTAILSTGLVLVGVISFFSGLILGSVTQARQELKRLIYLSLPRLGQ